MAETDSIATGFRVFMAGDGALPYAASAENHAHHVEFKVYRVWQVEAPWKGIGFHRDGSAVTPDLVQNVEEAEVFLEGDVKWDGCSNWSFRDNGVMLHFCDVESAAEIGELFRRLYAWAKEFGQDRLD